MIVDTHAHLAFPDFVDDFENVLARAKDAGVCKIVNVGCDLKSCPKVIEMAAKYDFLYATLGLHPYESLLISDEIIADWENLIIKDKAGARRIVAIGETGLDYFKSDIDHEKQKLSFRKQLELARKMDLPVIVHNRNADQDCFDLLQEFSGVDGKKRVEAVFHCYGSSLEFAEKIWAAGYYTSFTGIITYPSANELREVVRKAPISKIMIETDAPYLAPQGHRGERNEPAFVADILKFIAKLRGVELPEIEKELYDNSVRFFSL